MPSPTRTQEAIQRLRARAERQPRPTLPADASPQVRRLVEELQLHQAELEIQYEELLNVQDEAETSRAQLADLYEEAPVGYCTLAADGCLRRLNRYASQLLGQPASQLLGRRLLLLVHPAERSRFVQFLAELRQAPGQRQSCELRLQLAGAHDAQPATHVQLEGVAVLGPSEPYLSNDEFRLVLLDVSAQQAALAALAASEARFRAAFEQGHDGMVLLDQGYHLVAANNAALRLLGLSSDTELYGRPLAYYWPGPQPDGRPTSQHLAECLAHATRWGWCRLELLRAHPNRALVWDELSLSAVVLGGQALLHAAWRDITERKTQEAELRHSQARLQEALAAAGTGTWSWELASDQLHLDARARHMLGLPASGPLALLLALVHPADLPALAQTLATARRACASFDAEHRLLHSDGTVRYIAITGRFACDEARGEATRCDALVRDITDRRQAEQELDYKNRLLHTLFTNAPVLLTRIGLDGRIREHAGPPVRRMGLADNELVGRLAAEVWPDSAAYFERLLAGKPVSYRAVRVGQQVAGYPLAGGPTTPVHLQVHGYFDHETQQALLFGTDITEAELLKEEATQQRLRRQQELHTVMLTTQEEERRRIAESLHNGVGQLLYATRLHLDQLPPTEELQASQELLNEAIRATRTVSFELTPPSLSDFGLPAALRELVGRVPTRSLRIDLHTSGLEAHLPTLLQTAVYRMVQELLNNVMKHAQAHEVFVSVTREANELHLSVEDDGRGFDPSQAATGIGLASIRSRAELLGGALEVHSQLGRGSNFYVQLPVRE